MITISFSQFIILLILTITFIFVILNKFIKKIIDHFNNIENKKVHITDAVDYMPILNIGIFFVNVIYFLFEHILDTKD